MAAVEAYLNDHALTPAEIGAVRAYLATWIAAEWYGPCVIETLVDGLRSSVGKLDSVPSIRTWLAMADRAGIDPPV